jgi:hypothetical protein
LRPATPTGDSTDSAASDFASFSTGDPDAMLIEPIAAQPMLRIVIYLWTFPTTLLGLIFVPLALMSGGGMRVVDGVLEVYGGFVTFFLSRLTLLRGGASAMALGHVVLGRSPALLNATRQHERVHVRQAERWGPLFVPAYLLASLITYLSGRRAYEDNPFEIEAFTEAP